MSDVLFMQQRQIYADLDSHSQHMIPLREPSQLHSTALATRLFSLSEGYIGELSDLLTLAAVAAVKSGRERIDEHALKAIHWVPPSDRKRQQASGG